MEYGLVFPLMLFIPIFYTIWNLCILLIKRECWYSNFGFTLIAGGYLYYMMIRYCPERVDWDVQLDCYKLHSSYYIVVVFRDPLQGLYHFLIPLYLWIGMRYDVGDAVDWFFPPTA